MAFSAKAVANEFIELAEAEGELLSPMKLQKLVYFAHGWHLALHDEPLVHAQVEAWKFGPVIKTLYSEFRSFGRAPITRLATEYEPGKTLLTGKFLPPKIPDDAEGIKARELIKRVWDVYKGYTAIQLSNLTHRPGSPWEQIVTQYDGNPPDNTDIPLELIRQYFQEQAQASRGQKG